MCRLYHVNIYSGWLIPPYSAGVYNKLRGTSASFPTPSMVSYSSELYLHASCGTSKGQERMENGRTELE